MEEVGGEGTSEKDKKEGKEGVREDRKTRGN